MALVLFNPTNSRVSFRLFPGKPEGVEPPQWKKKKVMRASIINVVIEPKSQLDIEALYGVINLNGQSEVSLLRSKNHLHLIENHDVVAPGYHVSAPYEEEAPAEDDSDGLPETQEEPSEEEDSAEEAPLVVVPDAVPTPAEPMDEPPPPPVAASSVTVSQTPNLCSCGHLAASPSGLKGHQRKCQVHQAALASTTPVT